MNPLDGWTPDPRVRMYILDAEGNPVPEPDPHRWSAWYDAHGATPLEVSKLDNGVRIVTVFLGIDYNFSERGPALLWQTHIAGGQNHGGQRLDPSRLRALATHSALRDHERARAAKNSQKPRATLNDLYEISRANTLPSRVTRLIGMIQSAPGSEHPRLIEAAACIECSWLGHLEGRFEGPLCPAYPRLRRRRQAELALGKKPQDFFRSLTRREAHQCLRDGYEDPRKWIVDRALVDVAKGFPRLPGVYPISMAVARWIAACVRDPERRAALLRPRSTRGVGVGERIGGTFLDRVDELHTADLVHGTATSVTLAFERARERARERRKRDAARRHTPLTKTPEWWQPIRCARLLLTPAELVTEGREMSHCVGNYSDEVRKGRCLIVAIRIDTRSGTYRSTVEIHPKRGSVRQHKAKCNGQPHPLCVRALQVCLRRWGFQKKGKHR